MIDSRLFQENELCIRNITINSGYRPAGRAVDHRKNPRPYHGLFFIWEGEARFWPNDGPALIIHPGELLYIPAGCAFVLKAQYLRAAIVSFAPLGKEHEPLAPTSPEQFKPELSCCCPAPFDRVIRLDEFESVWDEVERITELYLAGDEYSLAKAAALLKLLLVKIAEASDESALPLRMTETLDQYIRDHAGEEISNTEVGAIFGYHPFYVSTVIKEKRGITLRQYVIAYRLKLAKNMLEHTDKTIAEIAEETGFTDASYFTKCFKAAFDETPKEWRAKFKEDVI